MQVHNVLDPTFLGAVKRQLSNRARHSRSASLLTLDMSTRIEWLTRDDAFLDEPATSPARSLLLVELPDLQAVCPNHGERQFRVERAQAITVRDILAELNAFLHRQAPTLVGNFSTSTWENKAESDDSQELQLGRPKTVGFDNTTPDTSESSLSSDDNINEEADSKETVMAQWLGEKSAFAGLKCAKNHDFKLIVKMVRPNAKHKHAE